MNSLKKVALVGCALLASTALLVSFTQKNDDDKKKKYQIIHHSDGEMVTYDTIISMTSSYTPQQFLADKGISNEDVKIISIPDISEMNTDGKMMRTFVHEVDIEEDGNGTEETVEIRVEMDENGEMKTKKTVNGIEVEMTEDELIEIKSHHGDHGKMVKMRIGDEEIGEMDERVEILVEMDDDGKKKITKIVNGEEVEMTEEDLENMEILKMPHGDDMNVFIHSEEFDGDMKEIEMKIEKIIEEVGDDAQFIVKHVEINSDGNDFEFESKEGDHQVKIMTMGEVEDHTIVLVTENYDEANSNQAKVMFESSSEEMDVYPNPNDGTFKIRYESDEKKKTSIMVTDASGKKVFQEDLGKFSGSYEKQLNLKEFGSGMYTITIQNGNNKEIQKVMVK
ncbi:MAG: T9SS type A sorting domain-containing protein [Crocinitomicaceae bacterium]|nr:T9SS type A sorting domain-containing protein [Crocinitomicaceae bacterium]